MSRDGANVAIYFASSFLSEDSSMSKIHQRRLGNRKWSNKYQHNVVVATSAIVMFCGSFGCIPESAISQKMHLTAAPGFFVLRD